MLDSFGSSISPFPLGLAAAILIAASSNNVLKAGYAMFFGGVRACLRPALALLFLAAAGVGLALAHLRSGAGIDARRVAPRGGKSLDSPEADRS